MPLSFRKATHSVVHSVGMALAFEQGRMINPRSRRRVDVDRAVKSYLYSILTILRVRV